MTTQVRLTNFELLRIVAMLMIITHHYAIHGIRQVFNPEMSEIWLEGDSFHKIITSFVIPGGTIGVGIFFLLTGFFMYGKTYKIQRLFKLLLQVYFYSFIMFVICILLKHFQIYDFSELKLTNIDLIKNAILPITSKSSGWFTQTYFVLFLFIPIINKYLEKINTKYSVYLLIFVWLSWYAGTALLQSNYTDLQRGIFFYLLGAHLKRVKFCVNKTIAMLLFISMWVIFALIDIYVVMRLSGTLVFVLRQIRHLVCIPIAVVALFCFFNNMTIKSNTFINSVAATTFGIYLIHDCVIGKPLVWNCIFHTLDIQYKSNLFPLLLFGTCVAIFGVCSLIDYLRAILLERKYEPICNRLIETIVFRSKII